MFFNLNSFKNPISLESPEVLCTRYLLHIQVKWDQISWYTTSESFWLYLTTLIYLWPPPRNTSCTMKPYRSYFINKLCNGNRNNQKFNSLSVLISLLWSTSERNICMVTRLKTIFYITTQQRHSVRLENNLRYKRTEICVLWCVYSMCLYLKSTS